MRLLIYLTSACLTLFATSAVAQTVTYDYDRAANFSSYKTYAWTPAADVPNELNYTRVVRAIDAALGANRLVPVEPGANPDMLVAYHVSFEESTEMSGSGWGSLGRGGGSARISADSDRNARRRSIRRPNTRGRVAKRGEQ